jgi:hypothetical protein
MSFYFGRGRYDSFSYIFEIYTVKICIVSSFPVDGKLVHFISVNSSGGARGGPDGAEP